MALDEYRKKRDASRTPEPMHHTADDAVGFVVQQHDASRMHYDFRLAIDGVLASWAVPKGPSLDPADKRLAMRTEDHPLAYGSFEGVIPEGSYGAGAVIVWDHGTFEPDGDPVAGLERGELTFTLHGEKLRGGWRLVRMKGRQEKGEPWLLMKRNDDEARRDGSQPVVAAPGSVRTGRTVQQVAAGVEALEVDPAADPLPDDVEPQLASRASSPPRGEEWISEVKLDGYRLRARREGGRVVLRSRRGLDWTNRLPRIEAAVAGLPGGDLFLDGELVVLDARGRSDFAALQAALPDSDAKVRFVVFDLLYADGRDLRGSDLAERRRRLEDLFAQVEDPLRLSGTLRGRADDLFREACALGLEGIVSKRADAPYTSGRGKTWRKIKCDTTATLHVVGYTAPNGSRPGFGALLLAESTAAGLRYAGKVGSGFSHAQLASLQATLEPLRTTSPAVEAPDEDVTWVRPVKAARVRFQTWTAERRVRQARFLELVDAPPPPRPDVRLTSPDRVLWPDVGLQKAGYADLLLALADRILPDLLDRPLSLYRCPEGRDGDGFWQKHGRPGMPEALKTRTIDGEEHLWIDGVDGLVAIAQLSALEIHVPITTFSYPDQPDRIVFDLDPAPDVGWPRLAATALVLRERLDALGLPSFARTTGGKGLHVVVPLRPSASLEAVRGFASGLANHLARRDPELYIARSAKDQRDGRVFLDWLRNTRTATAVTSWSPRARPGAFIAAPLAWTEVDPDGSLPRIPLSEAPARPDPWQDFRASAVTLDEATAGAFS